jgi:sodium-dependent dicarboxylate transporter 2/3/5
MTAESHPSASRSTVRWIGLIAGPALAALTFLILPEAFNDIQGESVVFTHAGRVTAALAVWMAAWWMTEAIPVYATALLPLAVLPFAGAASIRQAAAPYGHELIFLFMGGFIIALSMQRWGLHRRFAFSVLRLFGSKPTRVVAGFMVVTAALSMWVSNTATTIMMLPIGLSVIHLLRGGGETTKSDEVSAGRAGSKFEEGMKGGRGVEQQADNFTLCLLLGIAYAASIGGIGTLIGTPPNLFLASYVKENLGTEISFVRWMGVGLPLVLVFLPIVWLLLTRVIFRISDKDGHGDVPEAVYAHEDLGPMNPGEKATLVIFTLTALCWSFRPLLMKLAFAGFRPFAGLNDTGIAITAALLLFVIPANFKKHEFVMNWRTAVRLPWGLLILFGGGLSLAGAIKANGVGEFIASRVGSLAGFNPIVLVVTVITMLIFLTELTSNTATTVTLVPIFAALAQGMKMQPYLLIVPAAIAASCAFMLPVATPPNAIVFGTGYVPISRMSRAGLWLNIAGIGLITAVTYSIAIPVLGTG